MYIQNNYELQECVAEAQRLISELPHYNEEYDSRMRKHIDILEGMIQEYEERTATSHVYQK